MKDAPSDELLYEVKDGVGLVTFNRPAAHNGAAGTSHASTQVLM